MVCLKDFNRALLNYSLGGLFHFPAGGYTPAALETVQNRLTIRSVQDNFNFKKFEAFAFVRCVH